MASRKKESTRRSGDQSKCQSPQVSPTPTRLCPTLKQGKNGVRVEGEISYIIIGDCVRLTIVNSRGLLSNLPYMNVHLQRQEETSSSERYRHRLCRFRQLSATEGPLLLAYTSMMLPSIPLLFLTWPISPDLETHLCVSELKLTLSWQFPLLRGRLLLAPLH